MLKIGEFASLAGVSVKALRLYDEKRLLRPVAIDRYSSYRYYRVEQLARLNRILALKDMGFTLEQIGELLDSELPAERLRSLFDQKRADLNQRIAAEQARLARVAERLRRIEQEGCLPDYEVVLKPTAEVQLACLAGETPRYESIPARTRLLQHELRRWAASNRLPALGPWMVSHHYTGFTPERIVVEVGLVLPGGTPAALAGKLVSLRRLPALDSAACLLHSHPGRPVNDAYAALYTWLDGSGYTQVGPPRELILEDPAPASDSAAARGLTEIQLPVESRQHFKANLLTQLQRKENDMEPRFVSMPAFTVVGMRYFGKNEHGEIGELWSQFNPRVGEIRHMKPDSDAYGVCFNVEGAAPGEFEYVSGMEVTDAKEVPPGMVVRSVPAQRYAVFTHAGPLTNLKETYNFIYQVWLPQSGHQLTGGPDFEMYNEDFKMNSPESKFYIFVPVR